MVTNRRKGHKGLGHILRIVRQKMGKTATPMKAQLTNYMTYEAGGLMLL
jgi:hypothetical protein